MARIRVVVVEDSLTVRRHLVDALSADPELEVIAEAEDGKSAIELCESLRPDVVTLDMMLPVMTGLAATEYIMAYCPTPILIVSSSTNRGEVFRTYDALSAGAVDVLDKPTGQEMDGQWERRFVSAVKLVSRIKVITHPRAKLSSGPPAAAPQPPLVPTGNGDYRCVAIGASTGGPAAVLAILRALPQDFPLPILLVIHIGKPFGLALSEWLDGLSPIRVVTAADGQPLPPPGQAIVVMAPHDQHMLLESGRIRLDSGPERHSCRPSVDALFESVARDVGSGAIACLLTGMGQDGAQGMLALKRAGAMTLAQDQATSVVFGMPGQAIARGAASRVLPLSEFAPTLTSLADQQPVSGRRT